MKPKLCLNRARVLHASVNKAVHGAGSVERVVETFRVSAVQVTHQLIGANPRL